MRPTILSIAVLLSVEIGRTLSAATPAEQGFPNPAYVRTESASVWSGPGEEFFPTQQLSVGSLVEIYGHVDGTWVAIRPPKGSYSLVPVDAVHLTERPGIGRIVTSGTITRIGPPCGATRLAEYVPLAAGELVEILGTQVETTDAAREWYQITPPAGEFRWMKRADLARRPRKPGVNSDPPSLILKTSHDDPSPQESDEAVSNAVIKQTATPHAAHDATDPAAPGTSHEAAKQEPRPSSFVDDVPAGPPEQVPPSEQPENDRALGDVSPELAIVRAADNPPPSFTTMPMPTVTSPEVLMQELTDIELRLSLSVCDNPGAWQLDKLRARCQAVIDTSGDAAAREKATLLLGKIARFEDLQRRHHRLAQGPPRYAPARTSPPRTAPTPAQPWRQQFGGGGSNPRLATQYDGSGWLMPILGGASDTPRFALTDDAGNILQFVTASTGMNLRRYERQRIGVFGQRGYLPTLNRPHVTAERVVMLDRVRR